MKTPFTSSRLILINIIWGCFLFPASPSTRQSLAQWQAKWLSSKILLFSLYMLEVLQLQMETRKCCSCIPNDVVNSLLCAVSCWFLWGKHWSEITLSKNADCFGHQLCFPVIMQNITATRQSSQNWTLNATLLDQTSFFYFPNWIGHWSKYPNTSTELELEQTAVPPPKIRFSIQNNFWLQKAGGGGLHPQSIISTFIVFNQNLWKPP